VSRFRSQPIEPLHALPPEGQVMQNAVDIQGRKTQPAAKAN